MIQLNKSYQRILRNKNAFSTSIIKFATQISKQNGLFPDDDFITLLCAEVMRLEDQREKNVDWLAEFQIQKKRIDLAFFKLNTLYTCLETPAKSENFSIEEINSEINKISDILKPLEGEMQ